MNKVGDGLNPYEAPRSDPSHPKADVVNSVRRAVASRMLDLRPRGYGFDLFCRWNARRYAYRIGLFGASFLFFASRGYWGLLQLMVGLFLGLVAEDLNWAMAQRKVWPFQSEMMDWEKVQRIADGEPAARL